MVLARFEYSDGRDEVVDISFELWGTRYVKLPVYEPNVVRLYATRSAKAVAARSTLFEKVVADNGTFHYREVDRRELDS